MDANQAEVAPVAPPVPGPLVKEWLDFFERVAPFFKQITSAWSYIMLTLLFALMYLPYVWAAAPIFTRNWWLLSFVSFVPFAVCGVGFQWFLKAHKASVTALLLPAATADLVLNTFRCAYAIVLGYLTFKMAYLYSASSYGATKAPLDDPITLEVAKWLWRSFLALALGGFVQRSVDVYTYGYRTAYDLVVFFCNVPIFMLFLGLRHHASAAIIPWVLCELLVAINQANPFNGLKTSCKTFITVLYAMRNMWFMNTLIFGQVEMLSAKYIFMLHMWYFTLPLMSIKWLFGGGFIVILVLCVLVFIAYKLTPVSVLDAAIPYAEYIGQLGRQVKVYCDALQAQRNQANAPVQRRPEVTRALGTHPFYPRNLASSPNKFDPKKAWKKAINAVRATHRLSMSTRVREGVERTALAISNGSDTVLAGLQVPQPIRDANKAMGTALSSSAMVPKAECIVCRSKDACILIEPCCHLALCDECLDQLIARNIREPDALAFNSCPLCRGKIEQTRKVYY